MANRRRAGGSFGALASGAARGAIAAMAMSGFRQATTALGLVEQTPPESVLKRTAPGLFSGVPVQRRPAVVELIHWSYGAGGGMIFGALPRAVRRYPWIGPLYGFAFWTAFEVALAPLLGFNKHRGAVREQMALLADHMLYGAVVASSPWPHAD